MLAALGPKQREGLTPKGSWATGSESRRVRIVWDFGDSGIC